jgi:YbgC/YbaW family acyl-CoA thioester hydrolase
VAWGETDPAGIVYTARFLDYAVEAVEAWFRAVVGTDWYRLKVERGLGSPMAHASLDFRKPLFPAEDFTVSVAVESLGESSMTLRLEGCNAAGELCFEARLVPVMIAVATIRPTALPPDFRSRIEAYRQACAAARA